MYELVLKLPPYSSFTLDLGRTITWHIIRMLRYASPVIYFLYLYQKWDYKIETFEYFWMLDKETDTSYTPI